MTVSNPARTVHGSPRPDGNRFDLLYLEEAWAALQPTIAVIHAVSARADGHGVRALALDALSVQTRRLAAVTACLLTWDRPEMTGLHPEATEVLPGLHGPLLDRVFADRLTAHAHASIVAAHAEMVAGSGHRARAIARETIRAEYRQLTALDLLFPPAIRQSAELRSHVTSEITASMSRFDPRVLRRA